MCSNGKKMMKPKQRSMDKFSIRISVERCKSCGLCISFCPQERLSFDERINEKGFHPVRFLDEIECAGCRSCERMCPDVAIRVVKAEANDRLQI